MKAKVQFDSLLIFSEKTGKKFYSDFGKGTNIITGCNTSGKSSLIKSMLYAIGINDVRQDLREVLEESPVFRLDCTVKRNETEEKVVFIRSNENICLIAWSSPPFRYIGVNANNATERIKYKNHLGDFFWFSLLLESKGDYSQAPIEVMLLPYYVSQAVGWVYIRKSFNNLDYYRNFKEDYLDYYTWISDPKDRKRKQELEEELKKIQLEKKFYYRIEGKRELQIAKLTDEEFNADFMKYFENFKSRQDDVLNEEREYIEKCNELSYCTERISILRKVMRGFAVSVHQSECVCPVCSQQIDFNLGDRYVLAQNRNDTEKELERIKALSKQLKSKINSLRKSIEETKNEISAQYGNFKDHVNSEMTTWEWFENKARGLLVRGINEKLGKLSIEEQGILEALKEYKTDGDVEKERKDKEYQFRDLFTSYLKQLGVDIVMDENYLDLYKISSLPYHGVELLEAVMAYHFAFNKLIATSNVHRFPFLLDAIFKEDIDADHKSRILKFVSKYKPEDTQIFFSIAEKWNSAKPFHEVGAYNDLYFDGNATLIRVWDGMKKRSLLSENTKVLDSYLLETLEYLWE